MVDIAQIRVQGLRYLNNEQSLSEFNEWLIAETWDISPNDAFGIRTLFGSIERAISEYDAGHLSVEDLRTKLRALMSAPTVWLSVGEPGADKP